MTPRGAARHAVVLAAYAALAAFFCRPMPAHFSTLLLGKGGDASVTLWNMWHFRHALADLHANPMWTDYLYWPNGGNLLLHQYTLFTDLFAYPLLPLIGSFAAYNLHMLLSLVLAGYFLWLLARDWGVSDDAAFVGGALLAFAPFVGGVIDSGDGVCYQIMWPAALFVWMFARAQRDGKLRHALAAALALTIQWAYSYYYFMFCALLIPLAFLWRERPVELSFPRRAPHLFWRVLTQVFNFAAVAALAWTLVSLSHGQRQFHGAGRFRELFWYAAPYLSLWASLAAGLWARRRTSAHWNPSAFRYAALKPYLATGGAWAALNLPMIGATVWFMASGDYGTTPSSWRGGGNPTDPLVLLLPGAANPLWGAALKPLYEALRLGPSEVYSLGVVPLAAAGWLWLRRNRDDGLGIWFAAFAFSFVFTLGPWLRLFGVHTYLPLPFYFIHMLPIFNNLQHGMRFNSFATLFLAVLFAAALDKIRNAVSARWKPYVVPVGFALLALEYWPPSRDLWALDVPPVVARLGARPFGAMLPVPLGANFNGINGTGWKGRSKLDLAVQEYHRKPIVGGYLARVSNRTYHSFMDDPFLQGIIAAQDGAAPADVVKDPRRAAKSLADLKVRYVLLAPDQVAPALTRAISRWPVKKLDEEAGLVLYELK